VSAATTNKVVGVLATYWWSHRAACDTPEGIHRWWIGERLEVSRADVEEALRWMVDNGFVERRMTGDRSLFRIRADADVVALAALVGGADAEGA
jgi:hypothetical protein